MADLRLKEIKWHRGLPETIPLSRSSGEKFVSTAQNFEDVILWRALSDVGAGFYIDVGAGDPDVESVTRSFYERGWSGINIEPSEGAWRRICERRPRDINLRVGVGNRTGRRPFFLVDEGCGLSTFSEDIANTHLANAHVLTKVGCSVVTLARICEDHVARPVHFMKIDVEGAEREALEGADFKRYRPWIVLVEATYPNSTTPTYAEWENLLTAAAYQVAYFDGLNRFYVAEEMWPRLEAAFAHPPNVFDNFIRVDEEMAAARAASAEHLAGRLQAERDAYEQEVFEARADKERASAHTASAEQRADRLQAERDSYEQEVFEVNRHNAWLSQDRQTLIWRQDDLARDLERHKELVRNLYSSTSWKFARPVRAVRKLLNLVSARR